MVETQQGEIESLREELEAARREPGGEAQGGAAARSRRSTEGRENDLRKTHAARLAEAKESADKRVAAIQAQREADNRALRARHAEETARLRREHEERLAAEDERRKAETWALEERLREAAIQRETEMRAYTARLTELEAARLAQKSSAQEDLERVVERFGAEISDLREPYHRAGRGPRRVRSPQERTGVAYSARSAPANEEPSGIQPRRGRTADGEPEDRLEDVEAQKILAEERGRRTSRPGSRRRGRRAGATPKSSEAPWRASTGSRTRNAGSGRA